MLAGGFLGAALLAADRIRIDIAVRENRRNGISERVQIVAVCDPNTDSNDYLEWGKNGIRNQIRDYLGNPAWRENIGGCPGGREVGREVVDAYYARQRSEADFKACSAYADFRELLEKEQDLDAVKVMTPDHLHAAVSIAAMKKGKHVLMHKPVANRLVEGRRVVVVGSAHVGDLDATVSGAKRWKATVTATVHDGNERPVNLAAAPMTLAESAKFFEAETARYRAIAKQINLQPQ